MIFAELDNVPAELLKWVLIIGMSGLGVAATIIGIRKSFEKNRVQLDPDSVEVRKAPKRYNHDAVEQKFADHERRILVLEEQAAKTEQSIAAMHLQLMSAGEERALRLGARLDPLIVNTSEMKGRVEALNDSLRLFNQLVQSGFKKS